MGYYVEVPENLNKAEQLKELYEAEILDTCPEWADIPDDKALICVVSNYTFEAAGLVDSERKYKAFQSSIEDDRPRKWCLMDRTLAEQLSGYKE
jgi:hypothetical protein